jgi:hypothetical protein
MFGLLIIFGQRWGEPWYGKNAGLMEGLPTGLRDVELTGGRLLSVPGPVAAQRHTRAALNLGDQPQRACRCEDQPQRVCPHEALALTTLLLAQPRKGVGVTDFRLLTLTELDAIEVACACRLQKMRMPPRCATPWACTWTPWRICRRYGYCGVRP